MPLTRPAIEVLESVIGDRSHPLDAVFKGDKGGVFNHNFFWTRVRWAELARELGHPGFRFHDLRASAIVMWARAGLPNYLIRDPLDTPPSAALTGTCASSARTRRRPSSSSSRTYVVPSLQPREG